MMYDIFGITTWEEAKDKIRFKVQNKDRIAQGTGLLRVIGEDEADTVTYNAPNNLKPVEIEGTDIVKIYTVRTTLNGQEDSITITEEMLSLWGVTYDDVISAADKNMDSIRTVATLTETIIAAMRNDGMPENLIDIYMEDIIDAPTDQFIVVSNSENHRGAGNTFTPETQKMILEKMNGSAIVIPSSTEECIIAPTKLEDVEGFDPSIIASWVPEVNATALVGGLFLSDYPMLLSKDGISRLAA